MYKWIISLFLDKIIKALSELIGHLISEWNRQKQLKKEEDLAKKAVENAKKADDKQVIIDELNRLP